MDARGSLPDCFLGRLAASLFCFIYKDSCEHIYTEADKKVVGGPRAWDINPVVWDGWQGSQEVQETSTESPRQQAYVLTRPDVPNTETRISKAKHDESTKKHDVSRQCSGLSCRWYKTNVIVIALFEIAFKFTENSKL